MAYGSIQRRPGQGKDKLMTTVAIIGLGYVGLPLAEAFSRVHATIGFDSSKAKVDALQSGIDPTGQLSSERMAAATGLRITEDASQLASADFIIIAVPTPVDSAHKPDFGPLIAASNTAGRHMRRGAIVVYESTVYPGATKEVCVPVLEQASGLQWKTDFHVGYSPERINPGDSAHTLASITKIVAGDDDTTCERISNLYSSVVSAGVYAASSIEVAEAAKVIENTQRDLNIALMNELAIIFDRLGLDTLEVLQAAGTKWNFLPFRPGLVGGHCIGVDPYYLTHKAEMLGYHPQVILAGRRINDGMGKFVAEQTVKTMIRAGAAIRGSRVNVLGLSFKENCPDLRNSRVMDVISELADYGCQVSVHDPIADPTEAEKEYGLKLVKWDELPRADATVLCVSHAAFLSRPIADYSEKIIPGGAFVDVKSALDADKLKAAGLQVWRL
jgi:UDP-N-acetyl-D-galactosamine dehydrogenase